MWRRLILYWSTHSTRWKLKFTCFNHTLFVNRVGCNICLRQFDSQEIERIHPFDSPKPFRWKSSAVELLKMDGYEWSAPFSVDTEGTMFILLRSESKLDQMNLRVEVRSATKSSRYEVIFRPNFFSSSYRATMAVVDEIVQLICCLCESTLALEFDVTRRSSPDEIPYHNMLKSVAYDDSVKEHISCPTCHMLIGHRINGEPMIFYIETEKLVLCTVEGIFDAHDKAPIFGNGRLPIFVFKKGLYICKCRTCEIHIARQVDQLRVRKIGSIGSNLNHPNLNHSQFFDNLTSFLCSLLIGESPSRGRLTRTLAYLFSKVQTLHTHKLRLFTAMVRCATRS